MIDDDYEFKPPRFVQIPYRVRLLRGFYSEDDALPVPTDNYKTFEYVLASDFFAIQQENASLRKRIDRLRELLERPANA